MCYCDPSKRTPNCGSIDCVAAAEKLGGSRLKQFVQDLKTLIKTKNSWGKNELLSEVSDLTDKYL